MRRERKTANDYTHRLAIPGVFPSTFAYVPASFVDDDVLLGPDMLAIGNATYYHFGVLSSAPHFSWLCAAAGSSEGMFKYTAERVYNTFPWPHDVSDEQRANIENAARMIDEARKAIPDFRFADHYTVDGMPAELKEAHRANDAAVLAAYGLPPDAPETVFMAHLFNRYNDLIAAYKPERPVREKPLPSSWRRRSE